MKKYTFAVFNCIQCFGFILFNGIFAQTNTEQGILRIAASQFPVSANIDSNAAWIKQHMHEARQENADIIHFPECALSGYAGVDFQSLDSLDWQKLVSQTESIMALARDLNLWVLLGSTHRLSGQNKPHNSLYVINPQGQIIDRYDKRFCTNGDLNYFSPGDHFVVFEAKNMICGLLICYDIRFPELYRAYKKQNVQVIFQSFYNARQKPGSIHPKIMPVTAQARAATNYFYMSLTNSSARHSWPCHFITPDGLIVQKLPADQPGILYSEIDITEQFYDASKPFRMDAINGKLNSGETVQDERSQNKTLH
jgi:predicted amidohydrolase